MNFARIIGIFFVIGMISGLASASSVKDGFQSSWYTGDIANGTVGGQAINALISSLQANDTVNNGIIFVNQYVSPQVAINACPSNGCIVDFGINTSYSLSQLLVQRNDISLIGRNVTIRGTQSTLGAYEGIIQVGYGMGVNSQIRNINIEGISIDGSQTTNQLLSIIGVDNIHVSEMNIFSNRTPIEAPIYVIGDGMNSGISAQTKNVYFDNVEIDGKNIQVNSPSASAFVIAGGHEGKIGVENVFLNNIRIHDWINGSGIRVLTYSSRLVKNMHITNSNFTNLSRNDTSLFAVGTESGIDGFWVQDNIFEGLHKYGAPDSGVGILLHATYNGYITGNKMNNSGVPFAIGGHSSNDDIWSQNLEISGNTINNSNAIDWDSGANTKVHHNTFRNNDCTVASIFGIQTNSRFSDNDIIDSWRNTSKYICASDPINNQYAIGISDSGMVISGNNFKQTINTSTDATTLRYGVFQQIKSVLGESPVIINNHFINVSRPIGKDSSLLLDYAIIKENFGTLIGSTYNGSAWVPDTQTEITEIHIGTGGATAFAVTSPYILTNSTRVSINGSKQYYGASYQYTANSTHVIFNTAPSVNTQIEIQYVQN